MPSQIHQSFIQVMLAAVTALGISLSARADDLPAPTDASPSVEDTSHGPKCTHLSDAAAFLFHESYHQGTRVSGLSLFCPSTPAYAGLSAQQIRSPRITYKGEQDTLESLYLFLGVQMDLPVTPFAEVAMDLGDWVAEELIDDPGSIIDYYAATGLQSRFTQNFFMRAYYKVYRIKQENLVARVPVYGIQLGIRF